jgi:hypothetical protein
MSFTSLLTDTELPLASAAVAFFAGVVLPQNVKDFASGVPSDVGQRSPPPNRARMAFPGSRIRCNELADSPTMGSDFQNLTASGDSP